MRKIFMLCLLPLLFMIISCTSDVESPSEGLSTPSTETGDIMTEELIEKEYSESELEEISIDYAEKYRPQYHYSPKENWVNDPNGLVYYEGVWHLYYQYNPTGNTNNSNTHWGHATSKDLINWEEQKIALFPDDLGNMWSGTGVVDHNNTSGFFTDTPEKKGIVVAYSTNTQNIGIAYSTDGGYTFSKVSTSIPVVSKPIGVNDFRDPHLFWYEEDQKWKMVVAGGIVRIYESDNLVDWTHCSDSSINTECPNLLRMNVLDFKEEKWILSLGGRSYYVGSFDGKEFKKESGLIKMNEGPDAYAGITFSNAPDSRIIMISWLNNWAYTAQPDGKWNGCFTLPTELKLKKVDNSYRLIQTPVEEVNTLRDKELLNIKNTYYQNNENPLENVYTNTFELNLEVDLKHTNDFTLDFCVSDNEKISLLFKKSESRLLFNRGECAYGIDALKQQNFLISIPLAPNSIDGDTLKLRMFVDCSNVEIYINDGYYYFTARIQPFTASKKMILSYKDNIAIDKLTVHSMKSIWFDDEEVTSPHISTVKDAYIPVGSEEIREVYPFTYNTFATIKAYSTNETVATVKVEDNKLIINGLKKGVAEIKVACGKYYLTLTSYVYEEGEANIVSDLGELRIINGKIEENIHHLAIQTNGGDAYALSNIKCRNFEYSSDIILDGSGAAALIFAATTDLSSFYCVNLDYTAGVIKLWKKDNNNVYEVVKVPTRIEVDKTYNLKLIVNKNTIIVYLDNEQVINIVDDFLQEGYLGLNVWNTSARFNNILLQY